MQNEFKIVSAGPDIDVANAIFKEAASNADDFLNHHMIDEHSHQIEGGMPNLDKTNQAVAKLHERIHNSLLDRAYLRIAKMVAIYTPVK